MNELDILKQQLSSANDQLYNLLRQCQGLQQEVDFYKLKYEGIGSIFNRQHLQSQLDKANEKVESLERFYNYFRELYGIGLEIAYWHGNGDLEPFDGFFESAEQEMEPSS